MSWLYFRFEESEYFDASDEETWLRMIAESDNDEESDIDGESDIDEESDNDSDGGHDY